MSDFPPLFLSLSQIQSGLEGLSELEYISWTTLNVAESLGDKNGRKCARKQRGE